MSSASGVNFQMTPERVAHLARLREEAISRINAKYIKGQSTHGGDLWKKDGILEMAIDEAIDLVVYLLSEKERRSLETREGR